MSVISLTVKLVSNLLRDVAGIKVKPFTVQNPVSMLLLEIGSDRSWYICGLLHLSHNTTSRGHSMKSAFYPRPSMKLSMQLSRLDIGEIVLQLEL